MKPLLQFLGVAAGALAAGRGSPYMALSPGPGLPSLAELGLQPHELALPSNSTEAGGVTANATSSLKGRETQFNPKCYHANTSTMGPAMMCQNYLNKIGTQTCEADRNSTWTYMCNATMGTAHAYVRAQPAPGFDTISSPCSDVARGMDWILELCATARCAGDTCVVGGTNSAWGNGDLVLEIVGNATELSST